MAFLPIDNTSHHNLDTQMQRLTMEASVLSNVIDTFRSILPNLSDKLASIAANFQPVDDHTKTVVELTKFVETNKEAIKDVGIVKHSETLIPVPEGFDSKAKMCSYLDHLIQAAPVITLGIQEILSEYHIVLSTFISNKDAKTSIRDHSAFYKRIKKQRAEVSDPLSSYFDKGLDRSRLPFGYVYDQTQELFSATSKVVELNKVRAKHDLKFVKGQVTDCANLLKIIVTQSERQDFSEVSGAVAMDLSEGAIEVGFWVELVAIYHYRVEQAIQAVKLQAELIAKLK